MNYALTTPQEAADQIATFFADNTSANISVREEKAFADGGWLSLGRIELYPGEITADSLATAVRRGAFEWQLPSIEEASKSLQELLGATSTEIAPAKLRRCLDAIAAIVVRTGLCLPKFDPYSLEEMPFRRSTTVVADTSAVLQGGLDFIAKHLHPAARVKVPAVVQMEIVNSAERFLANRRAAKTRRSDLLIDHILSQGGQRVLLRLELQADTEIERTFLLGDPIRNAFLKDTDKEVADLNLSMPLRSYADRLILESARQHQAQANLGHKVQLLTSDQGLARMALAEGIKPLFFQAVVAADAFGGRLVGAALDPFFGRMREISLPSVLWELATAFGCARLQMEDGSRAIAIHAFGEGLSWSPYHSHADLLWIDALGPATTRIAEIAEPETIETPRKTKKAAARAPGVPAQARPADIHIDEMRPQAESPSILRFNPEKLLSLILHLDDNRSMSEDEAVGLIDIKGRSSLKEYRVFLQSANAINVSNGNWLVTETGQKLAVGVRQLDLEELGKTLRLAPSFALFADFCESHPVGDAWDGRQFQRGLTAYVTLGEITLLCAKVAEAGIYSTPNNPNAERFAQIALECFKRLDHGDGWVATGIWLEDLIKRDGVHPLRSRVLLEEANARGFLKRSTEGSTTDTKHDNHQTHLLRLERGKPLVEKVFLYRGDFLIPGKSSSSIRIESVTK